ARRELQLSVLRSPIPGVITRLSAILGASVDPAEPLVEVADPSAVDVALQLTAEEASRVSAGFGVRLFQGASPLGDGVVTAVSASVDSASRTVMARVRVTALRRPLRMGETVSGSITTRRAGSAIVVPAGALVPDGDGFKVFVVGDDSAAHERAVTVGA